MRLAWLAVPALLFVALPASGDCATPNPAAVDLANEGDTAKATNLEAAIEKYKQAHALDPQSHRILWKLALAHLKKEDWAALDATLAKAIALAPKHAGYASLRGMALARQSKWPDAKSTLEQAIALDPNIADAHFELAEVALRLGDEKLALAEYTKAIQLSPHDPVFYGLLADLYLRLGFGDQAEKVLFAGEANVKDENKKFPLYTLHGQLREEKGDAVGALASYEAAKKSCGPCNERGQQIAFFNLGAAYASLKPPRKSEAMLQLQSFQKMICKGAAAQRYADQCTQAQQIATKLGGMLQ
jgi:tetratricopeptide (TPR) repeat protein